MENSRTANSVMVDKASVSTILKIMDTIAENLSEDEIEIDYDVKYGDFYAAYNELKKLASI